MKLTLFISLSEYAKDGYSFSVVEKNYFDQYMIVPLIKRVKDFDIDMSAYNLWLAEQSEEYSNQLIAKADREHAKSIREAQEFKSKFMMIGQDK